MAQHSRKFSQLASYETEKKEEEEKEETEEEQEQEQVQDTFFFASLLHLPGAIPYSSHSIPQVLHTYLPPRTCHL